MRVRVYIIAQIANVIVGPELKFDEKLPSPRFLLTMKKIMTLIAQTKASDPKNAAGMKTLS